MKLNGTHAFKANSTRVFNAILDPATLQQCIPGCEAVEQLDANRLQLYITTQLPGLKGPYAVVVSLLQQQSPSLIVLGVKRQGRGGSIDATANIHISDQGSGSQVVYDASADLSGPIAVAAGIGKPIVSSTLSSVFEKLDEILA